MDESLSLTANLKQTFRELEWLKRPFAVSMCSWQTNASRSFPWSSSKTNKRKSSSITTTKRENETVQYNILHKNNTVVLFGMDKSACSFLREQYPGVKFYSQASPFIEFFSSKSRLGNSRKMYAHLRKDAVDVYGYERGRLLLANSFECRSTPDRVYYLLYIWKQLGFEQERDELHLTGDLNDKELLLPELRKFIRQVFIMNPATNLDLQAITLCE